ncbi:MAG TPA: helix-turn-helix domain-containing protein [Polyangiaceae bacterium]|nr:helix-turn-helix domain-containing protein [Polyangiaceae bacterium]
MKLLDLLQADRDRIFAAYQAELVAGRAPETLVASVQQFFSGIAEAVAESAGPLSSTSLAAKEAALVGASASTTLLRSRIGQLARRSRAPVLILGDKGVGKRHCARALHLSTQPDGHWFELRSHGGAELERCLASLRRRSSTEAELGMTVYVHELGEAEPETQAQLSRLLDEHSLPLRVIASSGVPLSELARNGKLRRDLVFRFSNELKLPALASRKEDIAPLVRHFAELFGLRSGTGALSLTVQALDSLREYSWPGNVNELRGLIERLSTESGPVLLDAADLPTLGDRPSGMVFKLPPSGIEFAELERQLLVQALALAENNQTRAASLLGLTRDQIRYRMAKFELPLLSARAE